MESVTPASEFLSRSGLVESLSLVQTLNVEIRKMTPDQAVLRGCFEENPLLRARLLSVANGPWFQQTKLMESPMAVFLQLGLIGFYKAALTALFALALGEDRDRTKAWPHLQLVARAGELVAQRLAPDCVDDLFMLGLLHDAAIPSLARDLPDYAYFIQQALDVDSFVIGLEEQQYGFNHAEVGALLAQALKFPGSLLEPLRSHHQESLSSIRDPQDGRLLALLALTERIVFSSRTVAGQPFASPPTALL